MLCNNEKNWKHFQLYREAFAWYGKNPTVIQNGAQDEFIFYLAANDGTHVSTPETLIELNRENYDTFDELKSNRDKVLNIRLCNTKERWATESACSCRSFQKEFICKHLLALAFYNRLKKCPQEGNNKLISKKRKRGRIALAKSALQKQWHVIFKNVILSDF